MKKIILLIPFLLSACWQPSTEEELSPAASSASQAQDPNKPRQAKKVETLGSDSPVVWQDPDKKKKWEERKKEAQK